jgi:hypothetical protein
MSAFGGSSSFSVPHDPSQHCTSSLRAKGPLVSASLIRYAMIRRSRSATVGLLVMLS